MRRFRHGRLMMSISAMYQSAWLFWCVVELEFLQQPTGFGRQERFVKCRTDVRVEVVHYQTNPAGLRKVHIHKIANGNSPVAFGAAHCNFDTTPDSQRLTQHERITRTVSNVFVVFQTGLTGPRRQRQGHLGQPVDERLRPYKSADPKASHTRSAHLPSERRTYRWLSSKNTTSLRLPGRCLFFSDFWTVS